ncbi:uncharacterized protein BT62DRAFT_1042370 [Guyanagaster necrorhizus]|uniref:Uncharacterized protein n=1 Tax=Guyanagaster necrorhizus TaxID=856835 RepID=A0A9P8AP68_9AGAR|nr:uncharacterized protein BT62DRAFT_1042370 [Guyanagaster necrorhizus MCA 3950]KAG7441562.1 hypothetical protein BT62DRAFT_1042370 [Guyanagaster necrorhizus MCA 3950]
MASLLRPETPNSDPEKGLKAWANQVLAKRRRNPSRIPHESRPPTPNPSTHWWKKRRSSMASSGEMSSMKSTDSWPDLADQQNRALPPEPRSTENGPWAPSGMKIPKTTPMPQIAGTNPEMIRIRVLILDQQSLKEAVRNCGQLGGESGPQAPSGMRIPRMTPMRSTGGITSPTKEKAVQTDPYPVGQGAAVTRPLLVQACKIVKIANTWAAFQASKHVTENRTRAHRNLAIIMINWSNNKQSAWPSNRLIPEGLGCM